MVPFRQPPADHYSHLAMQSYIAQWQSHMFANMKLQVYEEITHLECRQQHKTFVIVCSQCIEVIYLARVSIA